MSETLQLNPNSAPNEYDSLFDPTTPEPPTDPNALNAIVEAAAVRQPNLAQLIDSLPQDSAHMRRPNEDQSKQLIDALSAWDGFGHQAESEEEIQAGINRARQLVTSGQARGYLQRRSFVEDTRAGYLRSVATVSYVVLKGSTLSIHPDEIVGAAGFGSWEGRVHDTAASFEQICDYATRETALPTVHDVKVIITDHGAFAMSGNAHRAGAAKLREEPLQASAFDVWDLRGKQLDQSQAYVVEDMQRAASSSAQQ